MKLFYYSLLLLFLASCSKYNNLKPVTPFDVEKYYGTWHEVAKFDHTFEKECKKVDLTYEASGVGIDFFNECYDAHGHKIKDAYAKAYLRKDGIGEFSVYLFSIIYLDYKVLYVDPKYEYAMVTGMSFDYLWIISKLANPDPKKIDEMIAKAKELGFDTEKLIINRHI